PDDAAPAAPVAPLRGCARAAPAARLDDAAPAALMAPLDDVASAALMAPLDDAEFAALMAPLGPFGPAPRIAAGVSGGPHSLALALLADRWARARGGALLALVVDHGLRPGSAAEAAGVAALLAGRGIAAEVLPLGLPAGAGLQERARAGRHAALLRACRAAGTPWLLLGHHRADQAETLLFRALRGSGAGGLAAMAAVRAAPEALLLRPLLGTPPARLEGVVAAAGLAPVRDPSNADPRFARIALRRTLADPAGAGAATAALAAAAAGFAARRG
ncbi:tRNA lysidine(34) synthetase TilS, partial [Dankookia rubra]